MIIGIKKYCIMYIISGKYRGKKLFSPPRSDILCPTSNKNLENLINILYSGNLLQNFNIEIDDIKLLDLFAGTGIFGFENISQNISHVTFIDISQRNLDIIHKNAKLLNDSDKIRLLKYDLGSGLPKLSQKYNIIFLDPPYNKDLSKNIFIDLVKYNYLKKNHLIIVETHKKEEISYNVNIFTIIKEKIYGNSKFTFFKKILDRGE